MATDASQTSNSNVYVCTPPNLPAHLSGIYTLKTIVGHPNNEDVKAIHAAIRAVNAESQIPHLFNPDLLLQLSQHLFNTQMAVYRNAYPLIFPRENTYSPPLLPTNIPVQLGSIVGPPSDNELKAAQSAVRAVESLGNSPLFDPDLSMQLSQHLFNLQFARHIQDSMDGQFTSKPGGSQSGFSAPGTTSDSHGALDPTWHEATQTGVSEAGVYQPSAIVPANPPCCRSSEITQQGETMKDIKELMSESKGVLENMNRVLVAIQRQQVTVAAWDINQIVHVNPVNEQGKTATECGLPQLRYSYHKGNYWHNLNPGLLAGYLKFFGIGADLLEGGDTPRLKEGKGRDWEAWLRIRNHIGLAY